MFHDDFNFGHWSILSLFLIFYIYFKKKEFKKLEIHPKNDSRGKKFSGIGLRVGSFFIRSKVCEGDFGKFVLWNVEWWIWCQKCNKSKFFLITCRNLLRSLPRLKKHPFLGVKLASTMLVTDFGDEMCCRQFWDVGDALGYFGHQHPLSRF